MLWIPNNKDMYMCKVHDSPFGSKDTSWTSQSTSPTPQSSFISSLQQLVTKTRFIFPVDDFKVKSTNKKFIKLKENSAFFPTLVRIWLSVCIDVHQEIWMIHFFCVTANVTSSENLQRSADSTLMHSNTSPKASCTHAHTPRHNLKCTLSH